MKPGRFFRLTSSSANRWLPVLLILLFAGVSHGQQSRLVDFSLQNWDGQTVTLASLQGEVVLLAFSYAFCSVSCPIITGRLSSLDKALDSPSGIRYLHVSIDPEMDTQKRRQDYFDLYKIDAQKDKRWMFVSGKREDLAVLWTEYGIDIERVKEKRLPEGYYMKYSPKLLLIDGNGLISLETDFYFDEEELKSTVEALL
ncbi:MAG: SCO family protein [bacterium]